MAIESNDLYRRLQGPLSLASLITCVLGLAIAWILIMLGITLFFDMGGFDTQQGSNLVTTFESIQVAGVGVIIGILALFGWKGYMRFAY